jgi:glycosyltransferase involved in cell wall biosynthesis
MIITIYMGPWLPVPAIEGGAVNRRWQGVAEEFAFQGHHVTILCRSHPQQPEKEIINKVSYIRKGGLSQSPNIWVDLIKDFYSAVTTFPFLPKSDVLIVNDFWLPVFAPLKSHVGKIVINAARFPKGQYWLYRATDLFVATSNPVAQAIASQCPSAKNRLKVIPNPIDTKIFRPSDLQENLNINKTILYVGRLHPEKGIELLIESFKILCLKQDNLSLKIVGPWKESQGGGGETYWNKLQELARDFPIEFIPPVFEIVELVKIYQNADLFCYPSLADKGESFGLAPLEAMATGLVPIVSNLECFKDFITEGKTGFFFEHNSLKRTDNLANILYCALSNWEKTSQMKLNAIKQASNFSYENIAYRYLEKFEKIISNIEYNKSIKK